MKIKIDDIEKIKLDVKLIYDLIIYFINQEYTSEELIENIDVKDKSLNKQLRKANNKYYATRTFLSISFEYLLKVKEDLEEIITAYYESEEEV